MSEKLPGAEYAPIIAIDLLRNEQRLADADEVAKLGSDAILLIGGLNQRVIRRLSCVDPNDQRAIWRRAALALGARDAEAMNVVMRCDLDAWSLVLVLGRAYGQPERVLWRSPEPTWWGGQDKATAALCARVWGPK